MKTVLFSGAELKTSDPNHATAPYMVYNPLYVLSRTDRLAL